jgi:hypothetical protein
MGVALLEFFVCHCKGVGKRMERDSNFHMVPASERIRPNISLSKLLRTTAAAARMEKSQ